MKVTVSRCCGTVQRSSDGVDGNWTEWTESGQKVDGDRAESTEVGRNGRSLSAVETPFCAISKAMYSRPPNCSNIFAPFMRRNFLLDLCLLCSRCFRGGLCKERRRCL